MGDTRREPGVVQPHGQGHDAAEGIGLLGRSCSLGLILLLQTSHPTGRGGTGSRNAPPLRPGTQVGPDGEGPAWRTTDGDRDIHHRPRGARRGTRSASAHCPPSPLARPPRYTARAFCRLCSVAPKWCRHKGGGERG